MATELTRLIVVDHNSVLKLSEPTGTLGTGAVTSVNGYTGAIVLDAADVGAATDDHVHLTPPAHTHPISQVTNLQTTLDGKASVAAPGNEYLEYPIGGTINSSVIPFGTTANTVSEGNHTHSYIPLSQIGVASGVASLDAGGKVPVGQLPSIALTDTFTVASESAMLALSAQTGDLAVRTDLPSTFILSGTDPSVLADWTELETPTDAVSGIIINGTTYTGLVTVPSDGAVGVATLRTLGTGSLQAAAGDHAHSQYALQTITISAGSGLTGGGDLSGNRTLSVQYAGSGGLFGGVNTVARSDHAHNASSITYTSDSGGILANTILDVAGALDYIDDNVPTTTQMTSADTAVKGAAVAFAIALGG